jgi:hypothetical protein
MRIERTSTSPGSLCTSERSSKDRYHCQIIISWADSKEIPVPDANAERIALMRITHQHRPGMRMFPAQAEHPVFDANRAHFHIARKDRYHCQIIISWADSKEIPVPDANAERIALMNKLT